MRALCVNLLVEMEARLDFDDDLPPLDPQTLISEIRVLEGEVGSALETSRRGRLLEAGMTVREGTESVPRKKKKKKKKKGERHMKGGGLSSGRC